MANSSGTTGKKLINSADDCVDECLSGFVAVNDQLLLVSEHRIVVRGDYEQVKASGKVTLLSGGGSGHEPTFQGFVGRGMLTAVVAGSVFTSPPANNVLAALHLLGTRNRGGTLVIVANYTGDRLNFGLAVEQAKGEGHSIETFLVADDCAPIGGGKTAGRRGLCGIVLMIKVAGAMAEAGRSLRDIVSKLKSISGDLGTIGLSLSPCSIPGSAPNFTIEADEMELGLGVHGEAGCTRLKLTSAKEAVHTMFSYMTSPVNCSRLPLSKDDRVIVLVNNLGGTSHLEMYIAAGEAVKWLESRDIVVERIFVASLMTALEMAGFSLTILKVDHILISLIDAVTLAPSWPRSLQMDIPRGTDGELSVKRMEVTHMEGRTLGLTDTKTKSENFASLTADDAKRFRTIVDRVCRSVIDAREHLNELDRECGDGDTGSTLSSGAEVILKSLMADTMDVRQPSVALRTISGLCQNTMGGCSGALYGIFFASAAAAVRDDVGPDSWRRAVVQGTGAISKYGGAEPGDRTMVDALHAVAVAFESCSDQPVAKVTNLISAAARGASEATAAMAARAGRASYVGAVHWNRPDPGAEAVAIIFEAVHRIFAQN